MKRIVHTNYPIQVCSLTTGSYEFKIPASRSVVTKSRDGKSGSGGLLDSQSGKANQQVAGKRTTVGIVKVNCRKLLSEADLGESNARSMREDRCVAGRKLVKSTATAHGVKGDDMLRKLTEATGEIPCDHRVSGVSRGIRRKAESRSKVTWEVGDAHISKDEPSTETVLSKGALVCRCLRCKRGGQR